MNKQEEISKYRLVIQGDSAAFRWLFQKYQPKMFFFCYEFFHDEAVAKDIVQDTFIVFMENCRSIKSPEAVAAYLFRILRNNCLKETRARAIRNRFKNIDEMNLQEMELGMWDSGDNVLDRIFSDELSSRYKKALDELSEKCRMIFLMSRDKGMKYKDIAQELGLSQRTVENEVYRGLQVLKKSLKGYIPAILAIITLTWL